MQITTNALLLGKPTIIKENQYLSTKDYVEDFLNFFEPIAKYFEINVQIPEQITGNISEKDITYNKVWIQAIMPDKDNIEDYNDSYSKIAVIFNANKYNVKVDLNEGEWSVLVDGEKADSEVQYKIENSIVNVSARSACILIK